MKQDLIDKAKEIRPDIKARGYADIRRAHLPPDTSARPPIVPERQDTHSPLARLRAACPPRVRENR